MRISCESRIRKPQPLAAGITVRFPGRVSMMVELGKEGSEREGTAGKGLRALGLGW